ncbi:hypothetical protein HPB47_017433, partial [Ixodes persulcatus]
MDATIRICDNVNRSPFEPAEATETFLGFLEDRQTARLRGTLPDPPHHSHKRELPRPAPLGHGTLFGPYSRCFMYQVLAGILAVAANFDGAAAFPISEPWTPLSGFATMSTGSPFEPAEATETFLGFLEDRQMARLRGTLPDPPHHSHKRELPRPAPLGHGTLFGPYSRCFMYQ